MAETFVEGTLAQNMPVHYEFFDYVFFLVDGEKHFSIFMPGYPILLIPFAIIGVTFLANPILTALNILLVGKLANHLFNEITSTLSMLLFIVSPFMMTMGGTWMAHPFTAMLTLVTVFAFIKAWQSESFYFPLMSGAALGWLALSRPPNALFLVVLLPLLGLIYYRHRMSLKSVAWFSIPLCIAFTALISYNNFFTGNPITFVQDVYFNMSEPVNGCHSILPKRGCLHCNAETPPFGGMTWQQGFDVTGQRVVPLVMETFPHPLFFAFPILSLMLKINNREEGRKQFFLIALFVSPIVGYFFFYFNGNVYGPRYLYEGTIFFIILAASGIDVLLTWLSDRRGVFQTSLFVAFLVGSVVFQTMFTVPRVLDYYQHDFWDVGHSLKERVAEIGIENSVIFVTTQNAEGYGSGLVAMDLGKIEENSNIFVRDLGEASNSKYMHYMSGRDFFRVKYSPGMAKPPVFSKIEPLYPEGLIHVEFEDKFPPYVVGSDYPDYCNRYPAPERVYPYLKFPRMPEIRFSRKGSLYCRFENEEQGYTFGQYFPEGGTYDGTIAAVSGAVFGDFEMWMDGRKVVSFQASGDENAGLARVSFRTSASEGLHTFRIAPEKRSLPDRNYVMLDYIRFKIVRDALSDAAGVSQYPPGGFGEATAKDGHSGG